MRDWAFGQAWGSCYSWAALSTNDSKTLYSIEMLDDDTLHNQAKSPEAGGSQHTGLRDNATQANDVNLVPYSLSDNNSRTTPANG